jgi:hypothetical protein
MFVTVAIPPALATMFVTVAVPPAAMFIYTILSAIRIVPTSTMPVVILIPPALSLTILVAEVILPALFLQGR